jgi:alkylated DNA repair dioxygenase AlkB
MFDSLLDMTEAEVMWQPSLFGSDEPRVDPALAGMERIELDEDSWLDHLPRWLSGSDHVFAELVARVAWSQRRVRMYNQLLDEPRLTWWWSAERDPGELPLPVLVDLAVALSDRYDRHFDSVGLNFYRDGRDGVAWHGDRVADAQADPIVAIVSVGAPRPFLLRPRGGGHSRAFLLGQGDLLVMGGACQHQWEHTVPKVAAAGPRISITFRHDTAEPGRARSSTRRNVVGAKGWQHADGVRVREHPAGTRAS